MPLSSHPFEDEDERGNVTKTVVKFNAVTHIRAIEEIFFHMCVIEDDCKTNILIAR